MAAENNTIRELIDKLEALPPERLAEVEDFIDFLHGRDNDRRLTYAAARTAESAFAEVWDNSDDSIYDSL